MKNIRWQYNKFTKSIFHKSSICIYQLMGSNIHKLVASKKASGKKLILLLFVFIFIPFNKYLRLHLLITF